MVKLGDLPIGAIVQHSEAKYLGKPIQFEVVARNHKGYPTNSVTLQTKQIITAKAMDAQEPKSSNSNRRSYGNNNTTVANLMQWLNSAVSNWYKAQHGADQAPDSKSVVTYNPYASEAGFLTNFPKQFVDAILPTTLTTVIPDTDGGGVATEVRKVFLPSRTEVGLGDERSGSPEGSKWEKYTNDASRQKTRTAECIAQDENSTTAGYYWLRTPNSSSAHNVRLVNSDGALGISNARYGGYGVAPALNLSGDLSVTKSNDVYEIEFNQPPVIISSQPESIGDKNEPFSIQYTVTDGDNDNVKVTEKLNSTTLRTIDKITLGEQQTITLTWEQWQSLPTNTTSTITITADDGQEVATKRFTFTKRNNRPTLTLDVQDNETYYEGSTLNIKGTATDKDVGDAVIVKYKIADSRERVIATVVSDGKPFDYGKILTFTKSRFMDGGTAVTDTLVEGQTYTLEVYAQDDKGVHSVTQTRKFKVVPNRSPLIEVTKTPTLTGVGMTASGTIEGKVNDPDGDEIRMTYRFNGGGEQPIVLSDGVFTIPVKVSDLRNGRNTYTLIARDEYDAMTTRDVEVTLNAKSSSTDHIESKMYYKVDTAGVETDGVLLWLRRPLGDETDYHASLSITDTGASEKYDKMSKTTSIVQGHNRDEFIGNVDTKANDVRIKLEFDGESAPIEMLQGVIK